MKSEAAGVVLTQFVTPDDVRRALQCSTSTAYSHLRQAAGRGPGDRGLLRVPIAVWEAYAARIPGGTRAAVSSPVSAPLPAPDTAPPTSTSPPAILRLVARDGQRLDVRATQPRKKKSPAA